MCAGVIEASIKAGQAGSDMAYGTMTMPRTPSARSFATVAGSSTRGGKISGNSQCLRPRTLRRDTNQLGCEKAFSPSALGSVCRAKKRGGTVTALSPDAAKRSIVKFSRWSRASAAIRDRRTCVDSEARSTIAPVGTSSPRPWPS